MASTTHSQRDVADFGAILSVVVFLMALHFLLPDSIHQALIFDHARFRVYTLWTAGYIHAGNSHLFGNVIGYLLPTLYIYILCIAVDEQRWFRRTFLVFLTVLPVLVSLSSYAIFTIRFSGIEPVSRGFSGVAAGFGGFLLVALAVYIRNQHSGELAQLIGVSIFLLLMFIVDFIYAGGVRLVVSSLVGLGITLQIGTYLWGRGFEFGEFESRVLLIDGFAVVLVFVVLTYIVMALFPADIVTNGKTTNIFAHGVGFILGLVISIGIWVRWYR